MYGLRAGRLREVIVIKQYTEAQDSYGEAVKTYTTLKTVRGEARQLSGTEEIKGGQYADREVYQFTIRDTPIGVTNRLTYDSNDFEIIEIIDIRERGRMLKIKAAKI